MKFAHLPRCLSPVVTRWTGIRHSWMWYHLSSCQTMWRCLISEIICKCFGISATLPNINLIGKPKKGDAFPQQWSLSTPNAPEGMAAYCTCGCGIPGIMPGTVLGMASDFTRKLMTSSPESFTPAFQNFKPQSCALLNLQVWAWSLNTSFFFGYCGE